MLLALISVVLIPTSSRGDGTFYFYDNELWKIGKETFQYAYITYENGIETMTLAVKLKDVNGTKGVWMFPVPANISSVKIENITTHNFPYSPPSLDSENLNKKFNETFVFSAITTCMQPIPFNILVYLTGQIVASSAGYAGEGSPEAITIWYHGIIFEIVSLSNENAFTRYLNSNNLTLNSATNTVIDSYLNKNYTMIFGWIENITEYKDWLAKNRIERPILNIKLSFPTKKIFFPLKISSVFGDQEVEVLLHIKKMVSPVLYPEIKNFTHITYKTNGVRVLIKTRASNFTHDLWFSEGIPDYVETETLFINNNIQVIFLMNTLSSIGALAISNRLIFSKYNTFTYWDLGLILISYTLLSWILGVAIFSFIIMHLTKKKRLINKIDPYTLSQTFTCTFTMLYIFFGIFAYILLYLGIWLL